MHRPGEGSFGRDSKVLDYWLANCEGFTVGKRRVTAVLIDPETSRARGLVVRRSRRRTAVVAAADVTAVDPHGRVLYLASRRRAPRVRVARPTAAPLLRAARRTRRTATAGAARLKPVARSSAARARVALAPLRELAAAYAHNARTIVAVRLAAAHEATLRGPWTPTSPTSWTRHARRSPAASSRTPARSQRALQRFRSTTARLRS